MPLQGLAAKHSVDEGFPFGRWPPEERFARLRPGVPGGEALVGDDGLRLRIVVSKKLQRRRTENRVGIRLERLHQRHCVRGTREDIVVGEPGEVLAPGHPEDPAEVGLCIGRLRAAAVSHPRVGLESAADVRGRVGRGVVGDQHLEVRVLLPESRLEGLREVPLAVIDGHADGQQRRCAQALTIIPWPVGSDRISTSWSLANSSIPSFCGS